MGKGLGTPRKKTTKRRTGQRRSHLLAKLVRAVNRTSPVKVSHKKSVRASKPLPAQAAKTPLKSTPKSVSEAQSKKSSTSKKSSQTKQDKD